MREQEIYNKLSEQKYRITQPRKEIIKLLVEKDAQHFKIDDFKNKGYKVATIYNVLNMLTELKIIKRYNFENSEVLYEFSKKAHGHFICEQCGDIINLALPGLSCLPAKQLGNNTTISKSKVEFYGVCAKCNEKNE